MNGHSALLLLPGLLCDGALWAAQRRAFGDIADMRVADFTTQDTMTEMAQSALDLADDAFGLRSHFALAGLSLGGYVALEIMRQAPERVQRLALLDTSARPDTAEQTRRRRGLIQLAEKGNFKGVTPRLLPQLVHPDRQADEPLVSEVMAMAERVGQRAFLGQQRAIIGRPDSRPDLDGIACPTLILCGRQDALTPLEASEEMARLIPGARLVIVEGCGHLSTMERPEEVNEALRDWLEA